MMLRQTPQMLKKSGIKKGDAINYLAFIVGIVHVCVEKQSAEKRRDRHRGNTFFGARYSILLVSGTP